MVTDSLDQMMDIEQFTCLLLWDLEEHYTLLHMYGYV